MTTNFGVESTKLAYPTFSRQEDIPKRIGLLRCRWAHSRYGDSSIPCTNLVSLFPVTQEFTRLECCIQQQASVSLRHFDYVRQMAAPLRTALMYIFGFSILFARRQLYQTDRLDDRLRFAMHPWFIYLSDIVEKADYYGDCLLAIKYKKHLKNVAPIRHCEPPHAACFTLPFTRCRYCRTPSLSHAACASMSTTTMTTTTTTTRDRGDRYGPIEWAQ